MSTKLKKALLVMDMQAGILPMYAKKAELIEMVKKAIASARKNQLMVIYVVVGFREGMPEISPNNKGFSINKERLSSVNLADWMQIDAELTPEAGDVTVIKRRVSAFTGSDLEVILRANQIQHLVLTGISTSGVVLSTLREAADKDYQITVLQDACADVDLEVHQVLTGKVFPRQAEVISVADFV